MDDETSRFTTVTSENDTETGRLMGSYDRTAEKNTSTSDNEKLIFFTLVGIAEAIGITALILVGIWTSHYRGGFDWDGSFKEFNYHPVFMVAGLVVLYGNGMLVYRVFKDMEKIYAKVIHAGSLFLAFVFTVIGLIAVFNFHNKNTQPDGSFKPIPNMYSLHSWLGLGVVILFTCQWCMGFLAFLWPKLADSLRAAYLKIHVYFGVAIFAGAIAACLLGFTEKLLFSIKDTYGNFVPEGLLVNVLGILLVVFGGLVIYISTHESYKRPPENAEVPYVPVS